MNETWTKRMKRANEWLNRNHNDYISLESRKRSLEILKNRLGSGVSKYESDGTECHDTDKARARHEDTLLDFSKLKAEIEQDERRLLTETIETMETIKKLCDPTLEAIATDRYINCLKWDDIARLEHISTAQAHRYHAKMLEQMADILKIY